MDYTMMQNSVRASMVDGWTIRGMQPFYINENTARTILALVLADKTLLNTPDWFNDVLDAYAKHSYWEIEMDWFIRANNLSDIQYDDPVRIGTGALMVQAGDLRPHVLARNKPQAPNVWVLGCFTTDNKTYYRPDQDGDELELAIKIIVSYCMHSMIYRPAALVHSFGKRSVLERSKGKPRFTALYLSDTVKHYVSDHQPEPTGVRMPEHEVRGHWRHLRNGRVVFVRGHVRGDPAVPRRTSPIHIRP